MKKSKIISTKYIEDAVNKSSTDRININDLVDAMQSVGYGLVMMIFSFALVIPLPPPLPSFVAIPLLIFSTQLMLGYESAKLPKMFSKISVKRSVVLILVQKSAPYIGKIEKILRPRLLFITSQFFERIVGFFILIFSLFVMMPIPFSNFIPGLGILIISFGLLGKDGLVIICGLIVGVIGTIISIAVIFFGVEFIARIKDIFF